MKKTKKFVIFSLAFFLAVSMLLTGCSDDSSDEDEEEIESTTTRANTSDAASKASEHVDADSFTLMVYICGADLESEDGAATSDINEMIYSDAGDNLNIIIQTGGASEWQNSVISADSVQRYAVSSEGIELLDDIGQVQVTTTDVLSDFITFAMEEAPADRYGLIFWDHGGGTLGGYGCDENFDNAGMNISELAAGLEAANCHFDFIGFDCCLMATLENAEAISPYADYMIASEETEPGTGWYYTNFLNEIESDPGISMMDLGTVILNDYTDEENTSIEDGVTLSVIDLSQMSDIVDRLYTYLANSNTLLVDGDFTNLATARSKARSYGSDEFDQIDAIDYINRIDVDGGDELKSAIQSAVILNAGNISGSNGLALYYPYAYPEEYSTISSYLDSVGFDSSLYTPYFNDFMTVVAGGQVSGNSNPYSSETSSTTDYSDSDWYDSDIESQYENSYETVNTSELEITEKGDGYVLQLSDDDWDLITDIALQVYVDDGEGYLALGSDNLFDFDDDGDLVIDYDYNWIYLNDCIVAYNVKEVGEYDDGTSYSLGYIPALLNDNTNINIYLLWDNETGDVVIKGYQIVNEDSNVSARGYLNFKDGDVINFYFNYYDYDGNYSSTYCLEGNSITYDSSTGLTVSENDIGDVNTEICFWLKDLYGNEYWTEPVDITVEQ